MHLLKIVSNSVALWPRIIHSKCHNKSDLTWHRRQFKWNSADVRQMEVYRWQLTQSTHQLRWAWLTAELRKWFREIRNRTKLSEHYCPVHYTPKLNRHHTVWNHNFQKMSLSLEKQRCQTPEKTCKSYTATTDLAINHNTYNSVTSPCLMSHNYVKLTSYCNELKQSME